MKVIYRSIVKSSNYYYENDLEPLLPSLTVYEEVPGVYHTGLLDHNGNPIVKELKKERIGF